MYERLDARLRARRESELFLDEGRTAAAPSQPPLGILEYTRENVTTFLSRDRDTKIISCRASTVSRDSTRPLQSTRARARATRPARLDRVAVTFRSAREAGAEFIEGYITWPARAFRTHTLRAPRRNTRYVNILEEREPIRDSGSRKWKTGAYVACRRCGASRTRLRSSGPARANGVVCSLVCGRPIACLDTSVYLISRVG